MSKIIKLKESELAGIVNNIIKEINEAALPTVSGGDDAPSGGGSSKEEIINLQTALKQTEFASLLGRSGQNYDGVDGIMGPRTQNALKKFQEKNRITDENGFAGKKTWDALKNTKGVTKPVSKNAPAPKAAPKAAPAKTPVAQPAQKGKTYLYFDGKTLKFIINGSVSRTWNAWSGRTKWNAHTPYQQQLAATLSKIEFMKVKEQGPIPEGAYFISSIQTRTNGNSLKFCGNKDWVQLGKIYDEEYDKIGDNHNFNSGTAQDLIAWGNYRLPIQKKEGTNTFGRGSFYLHGGGLAGSIGCIDLVDKIDDFVSVYKAYLNASKAKSLDVYVDYSGSMKTPKEPLVMKTPSNIGEPKVKPSDTFASTDVTRDFLKNMNR